MGWNPDKAGKIKKSTILTQGNALALEPLCSKISSGGPLEKSSWAGVCLYVCMSVCPSIFDSGAQAAGRIGKGEYSFDAPEQWKHDGNAFRTARLHVARVTCDRANPCKKVVAKGARQTNGRIQLKLGGLIATTVAVSPFLPFSSLTLLGKRRWCPLHSCGRHVNSDFIIPFFFCARTVVPTVAGSTPFDSDRWRQDCHVNCRGGRGFESRRSRKNKKSTILTPGNAICNAGL